MIFSIADYMLNILYLERNRGCTEIPKACPNICRSRSAQSLKMLSDTATQVYFIYI